MIKADGSHEWRPFREDGNKTGARNSAAFDKIGARNSAADAERIQAMHDTSVELGACCPAHKALAAGSLGGLDALDLLLAKRLAGLGDALTQSVGNIVSKAVDEAVAGLSARLETIESQPQPLPFAPGLRAVTKGYDGCGEERAADVEALLADPGTLSLLAIKLAQRQRR